MEKPVIVDVDKNNLCIDPNKGKAITNKTSNHVCLSIWSRV